MNIYDFFFNESVHEIFVSEFWDWWETGPVGSGSLGNSHPSQLSGRGDAGINLKKIQIIQLTKGFDNLAPAPLKAGMSAWLWVEIFSKSQSNNTEQLASLILTKYKGGASFCVN